MTIGIGGLGLAAQADVDRARDPALRSDATSRSSPTAAPTSGCCAPRARSRKAVYGFVSLDSIPLEPHFRAARQNGTIEAMELDEGMLQWGLRAAAMRVSFLPCRAGLGSAIMEINPELRTVTSPYGGEELVAMPALTLDVALLHANRADAARQRAVPRARLVLRRPVRDGRRPHLRLVRAHRRPPAASLAEGPPESTIRISRMFTDGVVEAPYGAHFTHCVPDYERDEAFQQEYAATRPRAPRPGPRSARSTSTSPRPTTAA